MNPIYLDGEPVNFPDGAPKDLSTLLAVLSQHLSQSGRYVVKFYVDDVDLLNTYFEEAPRRYTTIKAISAAQSEFYQHLLKGRIKYIDELTIALEAFSKRVLVTPWKDSVLELNQCIQRFTLFVDVIDELKSYVEKQGSVAWKKSLEDLIGEYERYLELSSEAIERSDVAAVSDILASGLSPMLKNCRNWFRNELLPYFEKQAGLVDN